MEPSITLPIGMIVQIILGAAGIGGAWMLLRQTIRTTQDQIAALRQSSSERLDMLSTRIAAIEAERSDMSNAITRLNTMVDAMTREIHEMRGDFRRALQAMVEARSSRGAA